MPDGQSRARERDYGREAEALFQAASRKLSAKTAQLLERAEAEARALDDDHVGTEHFVLALYVVEDTAARRALESLGISRQVFADQLHYEEGPSPMGRIPLTPRARMIVGLAGAEASRRTSSEVQPKHILLGVIHESEKWRATGMAGPHHLSDAARAVGATLADVERNLLQEIAEPLAHFVGITLEKELPVKKKRIFFVAAVSLLLLVSAKLVALGLYTANPPNAKEAVAGADGTWRVVSGERNGEAVDVLKDIQFKDVRFIIKGDKITLQAPTREQPGELKFDPSKTPKTIEIILNAGTDAERVFPGIYEVEGDTLKICLGTDSKARPSEFRTQLGEHVVLFVFQREKPRARSSGQAHRH